MAEMRRVENGPSRDQEVFTWAAVARNGQREVDGMRQQPNVWCLSLKVNRQQRDGVRYSGNAQQEAACIREIPIIPAVDLDKSHEETATVSALIAVVVGMPSWVARGLYAKPLSWLTLLLCFVAAGFAGKIMASRTARGTQLAET